MDPDDLCHSVWVSPYATPVEVEAPSLAGRLSARMAETDFGVRSLAEASGVDKGTISLWKRGLQTRVQLEAAAKVATVLETTVEDLLELPPPPGPPGPPVQPPLPSPSGDDHGALLRRVAELENDVVPRLHRLAAEAREAGGA
jgi:transcriptional regulator with XRE-family HTH domain